MSIFQSPIPPEQFIQEIKELDTQIQEFKEANRGLHKEIEQLQNKVGSIGLTAEELQGIHGLISSQIKLIAELQESVESPDDVRGLFVPIESLVVLVSLVSKPTD